MVILNKNVTLHDLVSAVSYLYSYRLVTAQYSAYCLKSSVSFRMTTTGTDSISIRLAVRVKLNKNTVHTGNLSIQLCMYDSELEKFVDLSKCVAAFDKQYVVDRSTQIDPQISALCVFSPEHDECMGQSELIEAIVTDYKRQLYNFCKGCCLW